MPTMLFALPIVRGQTEAARAFCGECMNPRYDEFDDSVRRIGLHAAHCYLLHTPIGDDRLLLQLDGPDPKASLAALGASQEPFAVWFAQRLHQLTGVALSHLPPEVIAEPLVDYEAAVWVDE